MKLRIIPQTIRARLILSHLLVSLVSITLVSIYAGNILVQTVRNEVEHHYEDLAFAASNDLETPLARMLAGENMQEEIDTVVRHVFGNEPMVHYTVFLPGGHAVIDSSGVLPPRADAETSPEVFAAMADEYGEGEDFRRDALGKEAFYLAVRVEHDDLVYGVLRLEVPLQVVLNTARRSLGLLIATALIVALGMGAVGYYLSHSLADPLVSMTTTARRISHGDLDARVRAPMDLYEMHQLSQSFNDMAIRLQDHVAELRSFVANASHELRTPLTSIKLRVEALRNGALDDPPVTERFLSEIESEVDRLVRMVNDLLDLSRIEAGLEANLPAVVDLEWIASEVKETFAARAERAGVNLGADFTAEKTRVLGDEDQLRRMLYNLMDNAIKYTPRGGEVVLELKPGEQATSVCLAVKDTGFGIAKAQLPHVFERFYRVEATRPRYGPPQGSGLGLSIAKSIAEAHGGRIGVISQLGKGSTFWIELPLYDTD